jgi:hypothetical protein
MTSRCRRSTRASRAIARSDPYAPCRFYDVAGRAARFADLELLLSQADAVMYQQKQEKRALRESA